MTVLSCCTGMMLNQLAVRVAWWRNDAAYVSYVITVFVLGFVVPMVTMFYCYANVIGYVRKVGGGGGQENIEWTNEKAITKVSIGLYSVCYVCKHVCLHMEGLHIEENQPFYGI